ncbi:MAG TPA: Gfo/Idh/MocA family oxidoreductase [Roseiflexaceae bacterium]|nr:Gfo/Idh/MocA family oxidoreductase [Roseiflexaceae bacterium]
MAAEVGVGLVGYGAIGRLHALCYRMLPLAYPDLPARPRIAAVATASPASAERARRELGDVFTTTELETLLAREDVQVVDCCAPTGDHARVALAALAAGKALFCEKPLAATPEESRAIVELARARGLPGGVNFHFRQIPAIQEARRLAAGGLLGEVRAFHMRYYRASNLRADRPLTWRFAGPGSGVLADLGSHMIDLALHLLGPVARASGRTRTVVAERRGPDGRMLPVEGDDAAWLELELVGGGLGTVHVSKLVPGAGDDIRVEAYGSHGALVFDTSDPNGLYVVEGPEGAGRRIATLSRTWPPATLPSPETATGTLQWHLASVAAFLAAYARGESMRPGLEDGLVVDTLIAQVRER